MTSITEPYLHQTEAFSRFKDASVIPLFFEVGTGKSRTSLMIAQYKYEKGDIDRLLIIAPNGVHTQWGLEQIPLWLTTPYSLSIKKSGQKWRPPSSEGLMISCVNVDTFSTDSTWKPIRDWALSGQCLIILDEGQTIKNIKAKRTQNILYGFNEVVKRGRALISSTPLTVARIVLSGTPVTNSPLDLYTIFEFLSPGYFSMSYYEFKTNFIMEVNLPSLNTYAKIPLSEKTWKAIHNLPYSEASRLYHISFTDYTLIQSQSSFSGPYKNLDTLKSLVYRTAMTVHLRDCVDMPDKVYLRRLLPMSSEQRRLCKEIQNDLYTTFIDENGVLGELDVATILSARIRLSQIASGFISLDSDTDEPRNIKWIDKTPVKAIALMEDLEGFEMPVIIVTRFTVEATTLYSLLSSQYRVCLITGDKKIGTIEEFQNSQYDIMIANIHCIARGFNLQISHTMLYYSSSDSFEDRIQSEGRVYRAGQSQKCIYVDYVMESGMDEQILSALSVKKDIYQYFMEDSYGPSIDSVV